MRLDRKTAERDDDTPSPGEAKSGKKTEYIGIDEMGKGETQRSEQSGACGDGYGMNRLSALHHPVSNTR